MSNDREKNALLLTGGGSRGAYQAGVLKAIGEICEENSIKKPFDIISGSSSGAVPGR